MVEQNHEHMHEHIHLTVDIALPTLIRYQLFENAKRLLQRCSYRFGHVQLYMHIKHDGPQIACNLTLSTDDGKYFAHSLDWDVRRAVVDSIDNIELQIQKHLQKRTMHVVMNEA